VNILEKQQSQLTASNLTLRSQTEAASKQNKSLKDALESQTRALYVTRKMFAALAHEKNVESEKAKSALIKCRKLESKLGLQIGGTGLAKKLEESRRRLDQSVAGANRLKNESQQLTDDLVRACSEIKVLERAVQKSQTELDQDGLAPAEDNRRPIREQLLYQLALKKEESHNLALEIAHKTTKMKENEREIFALQEANHDLSVTVATSDAHVGHLTEQIIGQDLEMKQLQQTAENKERENEELLAHIQQSSKNATQVLRERDSIAAGVADSERRASAATAKLAAADAKFKKRLAAAEKKAEDGKRVVKLAEERLRVEVNSRLAMGERAVAGEENGRLLENLLRDVELIRRGLGEESKGRQEAEKHGADMMQQCAAMEQRERLMKDEMERTLDAMQKITRERDAAIQEVISQNSATTTNMVDRGEIERLATSKQLLQKALMEQLGNCKGQLNKEREARMKLEEELRLLRRERGGSVAGSPSPGAMMMASVLSMGATSTPTGTIRTNNVHGTPVTPALAEKMLKIDVHGIVGLPSKLLKGGKGTVFVEFSSTGVVGTSTVDAVCTRPSKSKEGGVVEYYQILSMIISPSAVIKIQVYRGSPFETHNEMIAYSTAPASGVFGEAVIDLILIEDDNTMRSPPRGRAEKAQLSVKWVWGDGMNSPNMK